MENIVLTGMPGCGKSTAGVLVAKALNLDFIDTDLMLQRKENMTLSEILKTKGKDYFIKAENELLLSLNVEKTVIATGGSSCYCDEGMTHLTENGTVIYIKEDIKILNERIPELLDRGVVHDVDQDMSAIFEERGPLYEKYAEITVSSYGMTIDELKVEIIRRFRAYAEKYNKM